MTYYIEKDNVHIFTRHFTTFLIAGTDTVREITDALLTVAALFEQTTRKGIIQLRLMLHSYCAGLNDFSAKRKAVSNYILIFYLYHMFI